MSCWRSWSGERRWTWQPTGSWTASGIQTYATFEDLYRYCYLVASVVGLVCIRIFGYSDPRAEELAEETGVAFQLTNILRDVKEDVERGRVYLPMDLMDEFGETTERAARAGGGRADDGARARHAGDAGDPRRRSTTSAAGS